MSLYLQVLKGGKPKETPVWLMRQAGRYLPEYRALRGNVAGFLDAVFDPEMAAEITLQPLRRFPALDAAILFSDILVIPHALGQKVDFIKGEGPSLGPLGVLNYKPEKLDPVIETLKLVKKAVPIGKAVIGFAGGLFTVACYMTSGRNENNFAETLRWIKEKPDAFQNVIDTVTEATLDYLLRQIKAGADALQIFESWSGLLAATGDFDRWVVEPTRRIVAGIKAQYPEIPVIGFPRQAGRLIPFYVDETGIDAVGLDQDVDLAWANDNLPEGFPVQGNLAPELLVKGGADMREVIRNILKALENRPHIFNLGHGVVPETPPEHVAELLKCVKEIK